MNATWNVVGQVEVLDCQKAKTFPVIRNSIFVKIDFDELIENQ
jgi:hypothetical protein